MSGNLSSDCIVLFSDIFNLFPDSFQKLASHLANRHKLAVYKDDGFGENNSDNTLRHSSLQGYADDLIESLEKNKLTNIIYIAHSVKGLLAFLAGAKAPHQVDKIILINSVPFLQSDPKTQFLCGFQETNADNLFAWIMSKKQYGNDSDHQKNGSQLSDLLANAFSNMTNEMGKAVLDLLFTTDCRNYLNSFDVPTLILQAGGDRIATAEASYLMHRLIPNSQLVKLKAKGHLPQLSAPEEIILAMKFFIPTLLC